MAPQSEEGGYAWRRLRETAVLWYATGGFRRREAARDDV